MMNEDAQELLNSRIVVHISDLHITKKTKYRVIEFFSLIASYYKDFDIKPVLIITGDIVNGYLEGKKNRRKKKSSYQKNQVTKKTYNEQFLIAKTIFDQMEELGYEIIICAGNHY